jgi:hypothetical protein
MKEYQRYIIPAIWAVFITLPAMAQEKKSQEDQFARIGNMDAAVRTNLLKENVPDELPEKYLSVSNDKASAFEPFDLMDTKEELDAELKKMRERYKSFLENHAPSTVQTRDRIYLTSASWWIETNEDKQDFSNVLSGKGDWDEVQLPHFCEPLGRVVTYYRKDINITKEMMDKGSLFICFKAVDYIANVFINGRYLGSHEGFFAPFEFNFAPYAKEGKNTLVVQVKNDYTTTGGTNKYGKRVKGDKIFGTTNLGYDDPYHGWQHSPPGMGIYQDCYVEARSPLHIHDIFVRPLLDTDEAEIWLEVNNYFDRTKTVKFKLSVYGQNFKETVVEDLEYIPSTVHIPGVGDLAKPTDWKENNLPMGYGVNFLKTKVKIPDPRLWNNKTPWLYQLQVKMYNEEDELTDVQSQQFGIRSFSMDTVSVPKGNEISQSKLDIEVFPQPKAASQKVFVSSKEGKANEIITELGLTAQKSLEQASVILIDDYNWYKQNRVKVEQQVESGKRAIFLELDAGDYTIADSEVKVENTIMGEYYFVSPTTGHEMLAWAKPMDFKFWHNSEEKCVHPFINKVFKAESWTPILKSGRTSWAGDQGPYLAVAEKKVAEGSYIICQLQFKNRLKANPVVNRFFKTMIDL